MFGGFGQQSGFGQQPQTNTFGQPQQQNTSVFGGSGNLAFFSHLQASVLLQLLNLLDLEHLDNNKLSKLDLIRILLWDLVNLPLLRRLLVELECLEVNRQLPLALVLEGLEVIFNLCF